MENLKPKTQIASLSIIIPVYNGERCIARCLKSVYQKNIDIPFEVIVVDDGSTDQTKQIVDKFPCRYFYIEHQGVAAARNVGIKNSSGEVVFFFDADVTLKKDTILKFLAHLNEDKDVCVMQGRWDQNSPFLSFSSCFLLLKYIYSFENLFKGQRRLKAANLETGCLAVRREVFEKIQIFNEAYKFSGGEEHELGMRLLEKYDIYYYADIFVEHTFGRIKNTIGKIYRRTFNFSMLAFQVKIKDFIKLHRNSVPTYDMISVILIALFFFGWILSVWNFQMAILVCGILFLLYIVNITAFLSYLAKQKGFFFACKGIIADIIVISPRILGLLNAWISFYVLRKKDKKI